MAIPQEVANAVLIKCGRRCCLCRRFLPIRLQVHHIQEVSKGGSDDEGNLIALCLTCHTDVHTKAPFTRRFSHDELKGHRNQLYRAVAENKFPEFSIAEVESNVQDALVRLKVKPTDLGPYSLSELSVRILVTAADNDGNLNLIHHRGGHRISCGNVCLYEGDDARTIASFKHSISQIDGAGLIESTHNDSGLFCYKVSHEGFLLADSILSISS